MRALRRVILVGALALVPGIAFAETGFRFDHALHVDDVGLGCADCHGGIAESTSLELRVRPGKPECAPCHDLGEPDDCGICHLNGSDPTGYAPGPATVDRFNHQAHLGLMDCADCHSSPTGYASEPVKSECRTCHTTLANYEDCSLCHSAGRDNIPESHTGLWQSWHGVEASSGAIRCEDCHVQDDCEQCHGGDNVRPRVHPLNFEFSHAVEARASTIDCEDCHTDQTFCSACHAANMVIPQTHAEPGWRDGMVHGPEALFEIESCIACHDAGTAVPATCGGSGCHQGG